MSIEVWGNMPKSQTDLEKIEAAIARLIQAHEDDPNAHVEIGESLYSHKASEIIDHIASSIIKDKLKDGEITPEKWTWTKESIMITLEALDGWTTVTQGASSISIEIGTISLHASAVLNDRVELIGRRTTRPIYHGKNPIFQGTVRFSSQDLKYFVTGGRPLASPGNYFGFKIVGTTLYACHYLSTTEYTTAITGISVTGWHTYRAKHIYGDRIEFYVDGILKATHTTNLPTGNNIDFLILCQKNTTGVAHHPADALNLIFQQDL